MSLLDLVAPWLGRRIEERRLPGAAARLGLNFHLGERRGQTGTLDGVVGGRDILVRPDKPSIHVRYAAPIEGLSLSTWGDRGLRRPPVDFDSGVVAFDRRFVTRRAAGAVSTRLGRRLDFFERAARFTRRWRRSVAQVDFTAAEMAVWLKERGMAVCYIKAATLEAMLPEMLDLVVELERSTASPS